MRELIKVVSETDIILKYPKNDPRERSKELIVIPTESGVNFQNFIVLNEKTRKRHKVSTQVSGLYSCEKATLYKGRCVVQYFPNIKYHTFRIHAEDDAKLSAEIMVIFQGDENNVHYMTQGITTGSLDAYVLAALRYLIKNKGYFCMSNAALLFMVRYYPLVGVQ